MNDNGDTPLARALCSRCAAAYDADDNFCRHCGLTLTEALLPSVRQPAMPAVWQPRLRGAVVRGAVYIAAGALGRRLIIALARRALGPSARPSLPAKRTVAQIDEPLGEDTQLVSETFLLRRIRIRR